MTAALISAHVGTAALGIRRAPARQPLSAQSPRRTTISSHPLLYFTRALSHFGGLIRASQCTKVTADTQFNGIARFGNPARTARRPHPAPANSSTTATATPRFRPSIVDRLSHPCRNKKAIGVSAHGLHFVLAQFTVRGCPCLAAFARHGLSQTSIVRSFEHPDLTVALVSS